MRTPMQELIEWIDTIISVLPDGSGAKNQMIIAKEKAESMLEKEKEVMKLVHKNGYDNSQYRHDCNYGGVEYWDSVPKPFDEFYNETFNTKEK